MHPINPLNFGTNGIGVQFYNGSTVVTGFVVKQTGTNDFVVTDGVVTQAATLAPTLAIATALNSNPTYCTIPIEPVDSDATGATFTPHYGVQTATVVDGTTSAGAWNVTDVLDLPTGAGTLTVATKSGANIATVTVSAAGNYTALFSSPTTATRVAGTGAAFTPNYVVDSATLVAAGTGYTANDVLTLATSGSATITVDTVNGSGVILTFHVSAAGTGVTALGGTRATTAAPPGGTGATFALKWNLLSVTSSGGTGYNAGDTLIFTGIVATTVPTAHISVATSHAATTVVVDTAGSGITDVSSLVVTTSTTTATFTLTYDLLSVTSSGGTGYNVGDVLNFNGMVATTEPTAHISTATNGAATAVTRDTAGSHITVAATSVNVGGPTEYVQRIWDNRVRTVEGNTYKWTKNVSVNGSAIIHTHGF